MLGDLLESRGLHPGQGHGGGGDAKVPPMHGTYWSMVGEYRVGAIDWLLTESQSWKNEQHNCQAHA
ncbi:MAG: hypothetical protein JWQ87_4778 [Candidatus Sulfotelmatobacter sp.]|nr:hypothetical protein [Candidatus Sulfotelmatobacter sp.]